MKNYEHILFDLDGTITDPAEGITNSVEHALKNYGINVTDKTELYKFIGPPLWDSFETYYGFTKEDSKKAVEYYREYFIDKGIFENYLYDGNKELLKKRYDLFVKENILYFDDTIGNINTAREFNINAMHVTGEEDIKKLKIY
jgi:phosphoglycolate phosphatase-like HAD superfamily hydrolase